MSRAEIERALSASPAFERVDDAWRLVDSPADAELFLNVEDSEIWTDGSRHWLEASALRTLRQLAATLEARMRVEEDDITDERPASVSEAGEVSSKPTAVVAAVFAVILAPFLIVVAVLRLPWVLWRITRRK